MSGPQILAIDLRMPEQVFKDELQNAASSHPSNMKVSMKEMQMRQSGKEMLKISVDTDSGDANFTFVAERDIAKGELIFTPFKLRSMGGAFFSSNYDDTDIMGTDDDPASLCLALLKDQCINRNGTIAYICATGEEIIVREGSYKKVSGAALVDEDNNVYTMTNVKSLSGDMDDDTGISFKIQTPINVWLQQNREVQIACSKLQSVGEKMDYIGQYLIQARLNDEIDQEEFMDIFRQAGIFGFTNTSVQNIYKLLT